MRFATWNVNSIRTRVGRVIDFLERENIDVLAMQETKCRVDQFPMEAFTEAGYEVAVAGYSQWNGVAIASRLPLREVEPSFPGQPKWEEKGELEARALKAVIETPNGDPLTMWSLYVPNGRELDHPHYQYKLEWLAALNEHVKGELLKEPSAQIALVGDWNIAPKDTDVWDIDFFDGKTHVSEAEREAFAAFAETGFKEVTRDLVDNYTYWDYQQLRFPRNQGMRIDFAYASPALISRVVAAQIDRDERKGKGASDHVPVIVEID